MCLKQGFGQKKILKFVKKLCKKRGKKMTTLDQDCSVVPAWKWLNPSISKRYKCILFRLEILERTFLSKSRKMTFHDVGPFQFHDILINFWLNLKYICLKKIPNYTSWNFELLVSENNSLNLNFNLTLYTVSK